MCRVFFIVLFCLVEIIRISRGREISKREMADDLTLDKWVWGYYNESEVISDTTTQNIQQSPVTETTRMPTTIRSWVNNLVTTIEPLPKYCLPYRGRKPNFRTSSRRLCVAKCHEYIWDMNLRVWEEDNKVTCAKYIDKKYGIDAAIDTVTKPGEYPHMGALGWKATNGTWVFKCGSSLISEKFVMTAARCTKAAKADTSVADPEPKIVRLGDRNIIDTTNNSIDPIDANILRIIVHPKYKAWKRYFDIALIELENKVTFSKLIQPACLWNAIEAGEKATLIGWGVQEIGSLTVSPELRTATVYVTDFEQCKVLLNTSCNKNWCGIQDHQLCAGKLDGSVDSCQGDSGGPLQVKIPQKDTRQGQMHNVFGIISSGVGCDHTELPGVYTRVSSFIDWIEDIVWKDEKNKPYNILTFEDIKIMLHIDDK